MKTTTEYTTGTARLTGLACQVWWMPRNIINWHRGTVIRMKRCMARRHLQYARELRHEARELETKVKRSRERMMLPRAH